MHAWMLGECSGKLHHILHLASGVCVAPELHFVSAHQAVQTDEDEVKRGALQHRRRDCIEHGRHTWNEVERT